MSTKLTERDLERLREINPVQLWAHINKSYFAQPETVTGQRRWLVDDVS